MLPYYVWHNFFKEKDKTENCDEKVNPDEKWIKHIHCDGARFHVLSWYLINGTTKIRCSEPNCIYNANDNETYELLKDKKMDKTLEYRIRNNFVEALERFDFEKVHKVMECLDWYWWGDNHSPSLVRMIETVKELFEHALQNFHKDMGEPHYAMTGGFLVRIYTKGKVEIQFIVEDSYSFDNE